MAEGERKGGEGGGGGTGEREEERVKLFVGQVPKHMTEDELLALFKEVALVDEVSVIKDKVTKASRGPPPQISSFLFSSSFAFDLLCCWICLVNSVGCCFLICPSRQEADKAVAASHNKRTLPGVWHSPTDLFLHFVSVLST